ncbi:hypothetical protein Tco_0882077 [Tanacetum coccineum]
MLANSHMKTRNISRVLRIILVILPEHQSDTKVLTITMEILPELTSNKLCGRSIVVFVYWNANVVDESVVKNLDPNDVNTINVNLEKLLESNMGVDLNDNASVATSNSTPTASELTHEYVLKQMAYPVVANYVKNTWSKYRLVKSMLNSSNRCSYNGISEDGLSAISTKLGTPLMLDSYTSVMCMCSSFKVFVHVLDECPKNIVSDVVKSLKNLRQASRGVQAQVSRKEVSNSNPFDALNSVKNDDDLGKLTLVDDDGKPLPKAVSTVNEDSDSEVEDVDICDDFDIMVRGQKKN